MTTQDQKYPPIVSIVNNRTITNSLNIAATFGKQHKNVLRDIESLDVPEDFGRLNFEPSNYLNEQGKSQPMYEITRDGFSILVMGFTGAKAMQFKLAYIDAFNKMEDALREQQAAALADAMKKGHLEYLRKGIGLANLMNDRFALEKVERFYWFRVHGLLTHYEAARVCNLSDHQADEIASSLREIGLAIPVIHGPGRKKEISRFFAEASGGFLPCDIKALLTQSPVQQGGAA